MPRLPFPIDRLPGLPADLLGALRVLPGMARDTAAMAQHTAVLDEVVAATAALPEIAEHMRHVAAVTVSIEERMAQIEAAMPVLVEVQRHLATLPETMERLEAQLQELQGSLEPIGHAARRLPGRRRAERRAAAVDQERVAEK